MMKELIREDGCLAYSYRASIIRSLLHNIRYTLLQRTGYDASLFITDRMMHSLFVSKGWGTVWKGEKESFYCVISRSLAWGGMMDCDVLGTLVVSVCFLLMLHYSTKLSFFIGVHAHISRSCS